MLGDARVGIGNDASQRDVGRAFYGHGLAQFRGEVGGHIHNAGPERDSTEMIIDWYADSVNIVNRPQAAAQKKLEEKKALLRGGIFVGFELGEK